MAAFRVCDYHGEKEFVPAVANVAVKTIKNHTVTTAGSKDTCLTHLNKAVDAVWARGNATLDFVEVVITPIS